MANGKHFYRLIFVDNFNIDFILVLKFVKWSFLIQF